MKKVYADILDVKLFVKKIISCSQCMSSFLRSKNKNYFILSYLYVIIYIFIFSREIQQF